SSAATSPETGAMCNSSSCHAPPACGVEIKYEVRTSSDISMDFTRRKYAESSILVGSCDEVMSLSCQIVAGLVSYRTAVFHARSAKAGKLRSSRGSASPTQRAEVDHCWLNRSQLLQRYLEQLPNSQNHR